MIQFHSKTGLLAAKKVGGLIELDFPEERLVEEVPLPDFLPGAIGVAKEDIIFIGRNRLDLLVQIKGGPEVLGKLRPAIGELARIEARGVILTSEDSDSDSDRDFVSRFFGPNCGVPEDPVTGSAHCFLAPFWGDIKGKKELIAEQLSSRGGTVHMRVDSEAGRVALKGAAVVVSRGQFLV